MAVTSTPYRKFLQKLLTLADSIDFDAGGTTLKILLLTADYTPDVDADEFADDLTDELPTSGGYTSGGATLASVTVGVDDTGHFAYVDAADVTWDPATFTCRYGVILKDTGSAATSPLIAYVDFGADQSPAAQPFTVEWATPANGGMVKVGG